MRSVHSQSLLFKERHYRISGLTVLARLFFYAQGAEDGSAHGRFGCGLADPEFPLSDALGNKHFDAGNAGDALASGKLQELRLLWPVDEVHHDAAI
jgi:hypothetical protein